jgi:hypothetical protein
MTGHGRFEAKKLQVPLADHSLSKRLLIGQIQFFCMGEVQGCLIVILGESLRLAKGSSWPVTSFTANGICYRDCGFGEFTEFYDWLRNSREEVIGVRLNLCGETEFLADYAEQRAYMLSKVVGRFKFIEIYFSATWDVDPLRSCDQGFVYDPVFRSDDGETAVAFDTGWLSKSELQGLEARESLWTEAEVCLKQPESQ